MKETGVFFVFSCLRTAITKPFSVVQIGYHCLTLLFKKKTTVSLLLVLNGHLSLLPHIFELGEIHKMSSYCNEAIVLILKEHHEVFAYRSLPEQSLEYTIAWRLLVAQLRQSFWKVKLSLCVSRSAPSKRTPCNDGNIIYLRYSALLTHKQMTTEY